MCDKTIHACVCAACVLRVREGAQGIDFVRDGPELQPAHMRRGRTSNVAPTGPHPPLPHTHAHAPTHTHPRPHPSPLLAPSLARIQLLPPARRPKTKFQAWSRVHGGVWLQWPPVTGLKAVSPARWGLLVECPVILPAFVPARPARPAR